MYTMYMKHNEDANGWAAERLKIKYQLNSIFLEILSFFWRIITIFFAFQTNVLFFLKN